MGNEQMRAATRLLGAHRDGYWLRRLLEDEATLSAAADRPVIDRSGWHPSVDWDTLGPLLLARPGALKCSSSELAVLEVAASLVSCCPVQRCLARRHEEQSPTRAEATGRPVRPSREAAAALMQQAGLPAYRDTGPPVDDCVGWKRQRGMASSGNA